MRVSIPSSANNESVVHLNKNQSALSQQREGLSVDRHYLLDNINIAESRVTSTQIPPTAAKFQPCAELERSSPICPNCAKWRAISQQLETKLLTLETAFADKESQLYQLLANNQHQLLSKGAQIQQIGKVNQGLQKAFQYFEIQKVEKAGKSQISPIVDKMHPACPPRTPEKRTKYSFDMRGIKDSKCFKKTMDGFKKTMDGFGKEHSNMGETTLGGTSHYFGPGSGNYAGKVAEHPQGHTEDLAKLRFENTNLKAYNEVLLERLKAKKLRPRF